jgi:hypothetical protein
VCTVCRYRTDHNISYMSTFHDFLFATKQTFLQIVSCNIYLNFRTLKVKRAVATESKMFFFILFYFCIRPDHKIHNEIRLRNKLQKMNMCNIFYQ